MALNAASHNATAEATGSVSGPPPPVSGGLAEAVKDSAKEDGTAQNESGKDQFANDEGQKVMGRAGKEKTKEEIDRDGT